MPGGFLFLCMYLSVTFGHWGWWQSSHRVWQAGLRFVPVPRLCKGPQQDRAEGPGTVSARRRWILLDSVPAPAGAGAGSRARRDRRSPSLPARLPRQLSCHRGTAGRGARPRAVPVWHPAHPGHPSQAANPCCSLSAWGFGNQSRWPLWQSRGGEGARMKA